MRDGPADDPELCSVKGCDNPGTFLPLFSATCKGKKGRGKNATWLTVTTIPTPMCEDHIHLPRPQDYFSIIDWRDLHARFNALGLPMPKRSTAKLEWVKAKG